MGDGSAIGWLDVPGYKPATWNPTAGCSPVSPGCKNCYAQRVAGGRLADHPKYRGLTRTVKGKAVWTGEVRFDEDSLGLPLRWRAPRAIFVNSMSDLFHPNVPYTWVKRVMEVIAQCPQHIFMILTKYPHAMRVYCANHDLTRNVWLGTSTEDQERANKRLMGLARIDAAVRFVSVEPMLGPVTLRGLRDFFGGVPVDWVICGGESGPDARPMDPAWARALLDECVAAEVPFFFKQWGGRTATAGGRELDGETWSQFPGFREAGR